MIKTKYHLHIKRYGHKSCAAQEDLESACLIKIF